MPTLQNKSFKQSNDDSQESIKGRTNQTPNQKERNNDKSKNKISTNKTYKRSVEQRVDFFLKDKINTPLPD